MENEPFNTAATVSQEKWKKDLLQVTEFRILILLALCADLNAVLTDFYPVVMTGLVGKFCFASV